MLILCGQTVNNKNPGIFTFHSGRSKLIFHYGNHIQSTKQETRSSTRFSRSKSNQNRAKYHHPKEAKRQEAPHRRVIIMLSKANRLSRVEAEALKNGKSVFTTLLSLRLVPATTLRFSVSVPKKVAPLAVDRNRLRRRCYGVIESLVPEVKKPFKVMIFPKKALQTIPHRDLISEMRTLFVKAGIIS